MSIRGSHYSECSAQPSSIGSAREMQVSRPPVDLPSQESGPGTRVNDCVGEYCSSAGSLRLRALGRPQSLLHRPPWDSVKKASPFPVLEKSRLHHGVRFYLLTSEEVKLVTLYSNVANL